MKIYKARAYVLRQHPGISGFQRWDEWEHTIIGGARAQNARCDVWREFNAADFPGARYFAQNGQCPEYQPEFNDYEIVEALPLYPMGIRIVRT